MIAILGLVSLGAAAAQGFTRSDARFAERHAFKTASNERVIRTWYHYTVSKVGNKYAVRTFFPETGALTSYYTYFDPALEILDGPYAIYSDDGQASTRGSYARSHLTGEWATASGDQVLEQGTYDAGLRVGVWTQYYPTGQTKSSFTFDGGEELGAYALYDTMGVVLDTGNSMFGERYTSLPATEFEQRRGRSIIDQFPCFGDCDPHLSTADRTDASGLAVSQYIRQNLRYPEEVRQYGVNGRVNVSILIDKTGHVAKVNVVNGLCESIAAECRRLLSSMPRWTPGTKNGQPADVTLLIPFSFSSS